MNEIGRVQVTIEPWHFPLNSNRLSELRITVQHNSTSVEVVKLFEPDDTESRFDYIFDHAKAQLKAEIKRVQAQQPTLP
jgi:hypothetical protein